ncbi:urease accessory protein UreD [Pararhizobium haloflavum]|uniref:urease accessory protein UreD n=1 Tax=Pararhizobium haloflavum TaxID=2037914 RepID=UPI000C18B2D7|nr:urease accessory protein UreD [Pararhizobium haloflavum]
MHETAPVVIEPALQRARGEGRLAVKSVDGESRLATLYQDGCAKIRLPWPVRSAPLEAVLINTSGGMTGGDRMTWSVEVGQGAHASVTTQACERIYRSTGAEALASTRLDLADGATLAWVPQETILFDRARFRRNLQVDMAVDARLLVVEPLIFGRAAMGEVVEKVDFHDRWRIQCGNRLIHAEDLAFAGSGQAQLDRPAIAGGHIALASLLLIADDAEQLLEPARDLIGDAGGVSAWTVGGRGKILARLSAESSLALRKTLMPLLALLNGRAPLPKIWAS